MLYTEVGNKKYLWKVALLAISFLKHLFQYQIQMINNAAKESFFIRYLDESLRRIR